MDAVFFVLWSRATADREWMLCSLFCGPGQLTWVYTVLDDSELLRTYFVCERDYKSCLETSS